jgi:RNA polymerase sigma-70 factor, ECF subfamily
MLPRHADKAEPKGARASRGTIDTLKVGPSDAELVERAIGGDRWAQEAIFRRYAGAVGKLARRLLGHREDADDVVQETFVTAMTSLGSLTDPSGLRHWLMRIAVFRSRRRYRRRRMLRAVGLSRELADTTLARLAAQNTPPDVLHDLRRIDALLARVSTDERIAWMLRKVEGLTLEEVAKMSGCSLATAKRRIEAVQVRLDAALDRERGR